MTNNSDSRRALLAAGESKAPYSSKKYNRMEWVKVDKTPTFPVHTINNSSLGKTEKVFSIFPRKFFTGVLINPRIVDLAAVLYDKNPNVEEVLNQTREYQRWLALERTLGEKNASLPMSKCIYEVWCTHILQTEMYRTFCKDYFGYFLDNSPNLRFTNEDIKRAWELYFNRFGQYPPNKYWHWDNICLLQKSKRVCIVNDEFGCG